MGIHNMKIFRFIILMSLPIVGIAQPVPTEKEMIESCEASGMTWNNWCHPAIVLDQSLIGIVRFSECQPISGLSCRITLLMPGKLPNKIFVQPMDIKGNPIGKEWKLTYPNLEKEGWTSGIATFMGIKGNATKLHLRGK